MKKKLKIKQVGFSCGGDGPTALYINNKLLISGDYYHDKIEEYLTGFFEGLKYAGVKYKLKNIECENVGYSEGIINIPKKYKDIDFTVTTYENDGE